MQHHPDLPEGTGVRHDGGTHLPGTRRQRHPVGGAGTSAVADVRQLLDEADEQGETRKDPEKGPGAASDREAGLPGGRGNGAGPDSGRSRGKPDSDGTG